MSDFTVDRDSTKRVLGSAGTLVSYGTDEPAFEFNADGSYKGLLVEPAATNEIRNNTMVGAVAGTPGTLPTNWAEALSGLTREVVGIGVENGVDYIDIRLYGTATDTTSTIRFESQTQIVAADGETWTVSAWVKSISETDPPTQYSLGMFERTAAGALVISSATAITPSATLTRSSYTNTLSGGGTVERVQPAFVFGLVNGNTYDFTIRIGWPQMEKGAIATSAITTTGSAAVIRAKDDIILTSASSLIGQTAGTLYVEVDWRETDGASQYLLQLSDGTADNQIVIYKTQSTDELIMYIEANDVIITNQGQSVSGYSGIQKIAFAYATDDAVLYRNGTSISSESGAGTVDLSALATLTDIDLGQSVNAGGQANMHIRAVAVFDSRLSNTDLETLTTI